MNAERVEELVKHVRSSEDAAARDAALELVQTVMDLHRAGLERMMQIVSSAEGSGWFLDEFAKDPAVSGILLLHDLHPLELEVRVRRAVEHPTLAGGQARVMSVNEGKVRIRVAGDARYEILVRKALEEAAPDAAEIHIERDGALAHPAFVPVESLMAR